MRVAVKFQGESLDFETPEDRVVGVWNGPEGLPASGLKARVLDALENPCGFPPLRQAIVPSDRVVIPVDLDIPEVGLILSTLCEVLVDAGVEAASIVILTARPAPRSVIDLLPAGVVQEVHDPEDRSKIAYLATTSTDRRIYLNRMLTDADLVIPLGRIAQEASTQGVGPWSAIYPAMSDADSMRSARSMGSATAVQTAREGASVAEWFEVSTLLGSQFHIGVIPGTVGPAEIISGLDSTVRDKGRERFEAIWTFQAERRADVVIAGIGSAGQPTTLEDLAAGLTTAAALVQHGGKVVALTRAEGTLGPALQTLTGLDNPRTALAALRDMEGEADYPAARQIAASLAWADVYLLSALDEDTVDDLFMVPLGRPEEARRLVEAGGSCSFLSHAESTRVEVLQEDDD